MDTTVFLILSNTLVARDDTLSDQPDPPTHDDHHRLKAVNEAKAKQGQKKNLW